MGYQPPHGYPPQHGYPQPPPGYPPPGYGYPPPKKGMSTGGIIALIGIGLICVLAVIGAASGKKGGTSAGAKAAGAKADAERISLSDLESAYGENEIKGDKLYKGKWLKVTGEVQSIDSGIGDEPTVRLRGKGLGVMANDISKDQAADLKKGQTVTLICKGGGEIIGSPVLNDCSVSF